jgi:hypothetical protein
MAPGCSAICTVSTVATQDDNGRRDDDPVARWLCVNGATPAFAAGPDARSAMIEG